MWRCPTLPLLTQIFTDPSVFEPETVWAKNGDPVQYLKNSQFLRFHEAHSSSQLCSCNRLEKTYFNKIKRLKDLDEAHSSLIIFRGVRGTRFFKYSVSFLQARIITKNGLEPYWEGTEIGISHWHRRRNRGALGARAPPPKKILQ